MCIACGCSVLIGLFWRRNALIGLSLAEGSWLPRTAGYPAGLGDRLLEGGNACWDDQT